MLNPPVTILVLGYNNKRKLIECLRSIEKTDYPNFSVVLVDNNSTDGSVSYVENNFPAVKIIRLKKNYGFVAYNYVVPETDTELVALINNDIIVDKGWLKCLVPYILNDDVAQVVPKLLLYDDRVRINAIGGMVDIFGVAWNRGNGEVDQGQYDYVEEVFYGVGAVVLLKKSIWSKIGGFDERYFMTAEDVDWSWRARLAGYKVLCVPEAIAYHHWLGTVGLSEHLFYMAEKNQIANFIKNYQFSTIMKIAPLLLIIKTLKVIYLTIMKRKPKLAFITLKAICWNAVNLRGSIRKRGSINKIREVQDREVQRLMVKASLEIALGLGRLRQPAIESILKKK
jgi:hypothetical protein